MQKSTARGKQVGLINIQMCNLTIAKVFIFPELSDIMNAFQDLYLHCVSFKELNQESASYSRKRMSNKKLVLVNIGCRLLSVAKRFIESLLFIRVKIDLL